MPAAVIPISGSARAVQRAQWSLLEIAPPGSASLPLGILLVDEATDELRLRLRRSAEFPNLEEQDVDILDFLGDDLLGKARQTGGRALVDSLEDALSGFLRIGDRTAITYSGDPRSTLDRLFDRYVDASIRPYVTHLPL